MRVKLSSFLGIPNENNPINKMKYRVGNAIFLLNLQDRSIGFNFWNDL